MVREVTGKPVVHDVTTMTITSVRDVFLPEIVVFKPLLTYYYCVVICLNAHRP